MEVATTNNKQSQNQVNDVNYLFHSYFQLYLSNLSEPKPPIRSVLPVL